MYGWFRHMGTFRVLVICAIALFAVYIFGNAGVDLSCGPDEVLMREIGGVMNSESGAVIDIATPVPTPTVVSNARLALEETMTAFDEASSFRYQSAISGGCCVNRGFVVRPSQASVEIATDSEEAPAARLRIIGSDMYVSLAGEPNSDEPGSRDIVGWDDWTLLSGQGWPSDTLHINPVLLISGAGEFLASVDSEIIEIGTGDTWLLSGLVDMSFLMELGYAGTSHESVAPAQFHVFVNAKSFLPEKMVFYIDMGRGELSISFRDYDRPGEMPAIPAEFRDVGEDDMARIAKLIGEPSFESGLSETISQPQIESDSSMKALESGRGSPSREAAAKEPGSPADRTLQSADGTSAPTHWSQSVSPTAGWQTVSISDLGISFDVPQTWNVAWTDGESLTDLSGTPVESGLEPGPESWPSAVSSSESEIRGGWLAWDALSNAENASFLFTFDPGYGNSDLRSAAEIYLSEVIGLNPALVGGEPSQRTFISDDGAVCALAEYGVRLGGGSESRVLDCLFAAGPVYVAIAVVEELGGTAAQVLASVRTD